MASEIRNRFTDTEMQIARETDLPELLSHLGYQVKRVGRFHTTTEMDSLRIKDRRTWFRYSQNTGGDAITFLQQFCEKSFPEHFQTDSWYKSIHIGWKTTVFYFNRLKSERKCVIIITIIH